MTDLPDEVLAALAAEPTFLANPDAEPFGDYNQPAEPMSPTEFAVMIEKAMRDMWSTSTRWHGTSSNPHITWPGGHTCGECGADMTALLPPRRDTTETR